MDNENRTNINWYPGHMAKTKKQIMQDLKLVDNIFEYYKAEAELGEKLGLMIERVGVENFIEKVKLR